MMLTQISLLTAIGAGLGLLTVATLIADFILNTIWPKREVFLHDKYLNVKLEPGVEIDDKEVKESDDYVLMGIGNSGRGSASGFVTIDPQKAESKGVPNPLLLACPAPDAAVDL